MATTAYPRIAIIGGGPGGLTLALTLHRRGVPFTVYERETSADSRAHLGGMLDLGYESGQRALRENGLGEVFARNSRPEADSFRAYDPEGNLLFAKDPDPNQDPLDVRPEIDRSVLRKILVDAIPANAVKWSHALASVRDLGNGERELTFANGNTAVVDILVGADGANSRVRPLISSAVPIYHGVTGAEISIAPEDTKKPELQDVISMLGNGSMFSFGHGMMLGSQLNGDGRIRTYAWFPGPEDWKLPNEPAEARKVLLEIFKNRAPSLRKLIEYCDDGAIYQRSLYRLPLDHKWEHVPRVTILGDAAHLMSPAAGAGVNLAMLDALELGIVLADTINGASTVEEREAAVATWEKERIEAANHFAVIANINVQAWTSTEDPASMLQSMFKRMGDSAVRRKA
ncbi:FAD/NAD(P)-binding domain-containing protein [Dichomitus squalens LYAD-421 SS1]|uniref:FAD/NAD(P)-binding domain-containing protein n=1 Tax=Dichomitus squalens (strain LYAD-421) TaxID=732165 RepID=R7STK8_DICSQ|nr:FAD/NAD(P)-binding domain-containing protein [Dichomitus squalens LYAD-421 SS1]EJF59080.1 FAD/NAD(P)-binding domain-containing protein [Dichomitus squalens LYAD-421 SS1]